VGDGSRLPLGNFLLPHSSPPFLLNRLPWRFTLRNLSVPCAAKKFRGPKWYPYLKI
jgi:hypothetical protein